MIPIENIVSLISKASAFGKIKVSLTRKRKKAADLALYKSSAIISAVISLNVKVFGQIRFSTFPVLSAAGHKGVSKTIKVEVKSLLRLRNIGDHNVYGYFIANMIEPFQPLSASN